MRAVVQRVQWARVSVDGETVGQCGPGLLVLVAAHVDDTPVNAAKMADRLLGMRIFADEAGKMNLSLRQLEPGSEPRILAVSQFTLYGDTTQRRPAFTGSAPYEQGRELFKAFVAELRKAGETVETGEFGAHMQVELLNDGPVTLICET